MGCRQTDRRVTIVRDPNGPRQTARRSSEDEGDERRSELKWGTVMRQDNQKGNVTSHRELSRSLCGTSLNLNAQLSPSTGVY